MKSTEYTVLRCEAEVGGEKFGCSRILSDYLSKHPARAWLHYEVEQVQRLMGQKNVPVALMRWEVATGDWSVTE